MANEELSKKLQEIAGKDITPILTALSVIIAAFALIVGFPMYNFAIHESSTANAVEPCDVKSCIITIDNIGPLSWLKINNYPFYVTLNVSDPPSGILVALIPDEEKIPKDDFTLNVGVMPNVTANKYRLKIEAMGGDGTARYCTYYLTVSDRTFDDNESNRSKAYFWGRVGYDLANQNRFKDALKWFDIAIILNNTNSDYLCSKGYCLLVLKRYEESLKYSNSSLNLNPRNKLAWENKGVALGNLGKYDAAIECFNNSTFTDLSSRNCWAWLHKGETFEKMKNHQAALDCFNETIKIYSGFVGFNEILDRCHLPLFDRLALCDADYRKNATKAEEAAINAAYGKGLIFRAAGRDAEANASFAKAKELVHNW